MPIYEFQCPKCHRVAEVIESVKEAEEGHHCKVCAEQGLGGVRMHRLVSRVAFKLGPGFYPSSQQEFYTKQRKQLEERSRAHDASPAGKAEREASVERLKRSGNLPEGLI